MTKGIYYQHTPPKQEIFLDSIASFLQVQNDLLKLLITAIDENTKAIRSIQAQLKDNQQKVEKHNGNHGEAKANEK